MPFQSTVFINAGVGVPGELYTNSPLIAQSYIINSASAAYNIFGTAFSVTSQGVANAGNTGSQVYAGILACPKQNASFGGSAGPLSPTLTLANYSQADIVSEGTIYVTLPAAANIGDVVIFNNTTGVLSTVVPGSALPSGYSNAYATVAYETVSAAGLAIIRVSPLAPQLVAVPEVVVAEGKVTWSGAGATLAVTVAGALTTDLVLVSFENLPSQAANLSGEITAANTLTLTLTAANTSNDAIVSYRIVRP